MFSPCVQSFFAVLSPIVPIQVELALNTHTTVSNTEMMVSDLHRGWLAGQGGTNDQHRSVSATSYPDNRMLTVP